MRIGRYLLAISSAVVPSLVLACSLTTSLDGLSSGSAPTQGNDAAVEAGLDAPFDAGDAGDARTRFCDPLPANAIVCEDFEGPDPASDWVPVTQGVGSEVRLTTSTAAGGLRALEARIVAGTAQPRSAYWRRKLAAPPSLTRGRFSYSLYLDGLPADGTFESSILSFSDPLSSQAYLKVGTGLFLGEQGAAGNREAEIIVAIPIKKWFRFAIEFVLDAGAANYIAVAIDGKEGLRTAPVHLAPGHPDVRLGITYTFQTGTVAHAFFDDALLEKLP